MKPPETISSSSQPGVGAAPAAVGSDSRTMADQQSWIDLATFRNDGYHPGRGFLARAAWYVVSLIVFESGWFPLRGFKTWLLRRFGARIGTGLVIKPQVRIKYPWRLAIGNHCWIGQGAWIDNLADVELGDHVCLSQGVYLCTGSHDHRRRSFDLVTAPIAIGNGVWVGAKAVVLPGCTIAPNVLVAAGTVIRGAIPPEVVAAGNPAQVVAQRRRPNE